MDGGRVDMQSLTESHKYPQQPMKTEMCHVVQQNCWGGPTFFFGAGGMFSCFIGHRKKMVHWIDSVFVCQIFAVSRFLEADVWVEWMNIYFKCLPEIKSSGSIYLKKKTTNRIPMILFQAKSNQDFWACVAYGKRWILMKSTFMTLRLLARRENFIIGSLFLDKCLCPFYIC